MFFGFVYLLSFKISVLSIDGTVKGSLAVETGRVYYDDTRCKKMPVDLYFVFSIRIWDCLQN